MMALVQLLDIEPQSLEESAGQNPGRSSSLNDKLKHVDTVDATNPASHSTYYASVLPRLWYLRPCRICVTMGSLEKLSDQSSG